MEGESQEGRDGGREPPSPMDEEEAGGEPPPRGISALRAVVKFERAENMPGSGATSFVRKSST